MSKMRYLSVCSGIGSDAVAWHPLGWETAGFAEIDGHASAVLQHRFPDIPNCGDFTTIKADEYGPVDLLTGGTPCQSFSVAGLRRGLDDDRGNLALEFCRLADRVRPRWIVWENVPGVYSATSHDSPDPSEPEGDVGTDDGWRDGVQVVVSDQYDADESHAFACILAGLQELGYGFAYRTLDAQYVRVESHAHAVPQRRRRVFLVGYLGDWRPSVAVLLEPESLRRDYPPRRAAGQEVAGSLSASLGRRCGNPSFPGDQPLVAFDTMQITSAANRSNPKPGDPCHPLAAGAHPPAIAFSCKDHGADAGSVAPTLRAMPHDKSHANAGGQVAIAFDARQDPCFYHEHTGAHGAKFPPHAAVAIDYRNGLSGGTVSGTLEAAQDRGNRGQGVLQDMLVRRITPLEAERLQGLPDNWTAVSYRGKPMADGPRYRLVGNAIAINCLRWIGERIALFEKASA